MDGEYLMEAMAKRMMEFLREGKRRNEEAQQAVQRVVERVSYFNGAEEGSRFSQFSEWEQRLVGVNKVLIFMKSIDRIERMAYGLKLEEDDDANGLIEDWRKVESVC